MEKEKFEQMRNQLNEVVGRLQMNFNLLDFLLEKRQFSSEEIDKLLEYFIDIEDYILCDKIIKKRNKLVL